jgi:hypothetical protein
MSPFRAGEANDGPTARNAPLRVANGLALAASPTFAVMALLTVVPNGDPMQMLCSSAHTSPLGGMLTMYLLMSAFHIGPWLRLIRAGSRRSI